MHIRITRIEERHAGANDRSKFGHLAADAVAGKTGSSCIITLTDRRSRYLLIKKILRKKDRTSGINPAHAVWCMPVCMRMIRKVSVTAYVVS